MDFAGNPCCSVGMVSPPPSPCFVFEQDVLKSDVALLAIFWAPWVPLPACRPIVDETPRSSKAN